MSSRQVFGVVVRTLGPLVILAGGHRIFYAFASSVLFRAHFPWHVYLVAGLVYLAAGAVLMWRAEWFVRFARSMINLRKPVPDVTASMGSFARNRSC